MQAIAFEIEVEFQIDLYSGSTVQYYVTFQHYVTFSFYFSWAGYSYDSMFLSTISFGIVLKINCAKPSVNLR